MVQDSKHVLKTFQNNLFLGTHLLTIGDSVAGYCHILNLSHEPNSPLYKRDVEHLDHQDDNAATQLFSANFFEFASQKKNHKGRMGDLLILFVVGEAINAYQNWTIDHEEYLLALLQLHYFIDTWLLFLSTMDYLLSMHIISCDALDITKTIVEGYIGLLFVFHDTLYGTEPLMSWLYSTEACEHVFRSARQIVPDFLYLDFLHMAPKLHIKIYQENLCMAQTAVNSRLPATRYTHTYFHMAELDLTNLSKFSLSSHIDYIACQAMEDVQNLFFLVGVNIAQLTLLCMLPNPLDIELPTISSWCSDSDDPTQENFEASQLLSLTNHANNLQLSWEGSSI
ncbi:hypothetical protein AN958_10120 [Leucoagaricus sp. SymC.cos]|nr:hypothetical protein AN958_10120 [Leucoagaricus sp. SymC.cos]